MTPAAAAAGLQIYSQLQNFKVKIVVAVVVSGFGFWLGDYFRPEQTSRLTRGTSIGCFHSWAPFDFFIKKKTKEKKKKRRKLNKECT